LKRFAAVNTFLRKVEIWPPNQRSKAFEENEVDGLGERSEIVMTVDDLE